MIDLWTVVAALLLAAGITAALGAWITAMTDRAIHDEQARWRARLRAPIQEELPAWLQEE